MSDPGAGDRRDPEESVPRYPPPQYPPPSPGQQGLPPPQPGAFQQGPPPPQSVNFQQQPSYYQPAPVYQQPQVHVAAPDPHWVLSIVSLLLSWVFGAIAMYFSYQVGERAKVGNMAGAAEASKMAKLWGWIGIGAGVLVLVVVLGSGGY